MYIVSPSRVLQSKFYLSSLKSKIKKWTLKKYIYYLMGYLKSNKFEWKMLVGWMVFENFLHTKSPPSKAHLICSKCTIFFFNLNLTCHLSYKCKIPKLMLRLDVVVVAFFLATTLIHGTLYILWTKGSSKLACVLVEVVFLEFVIQLPPIIVLEEGVLHIQNWKPTWAKLWSLVRTLRTESQFFVYFVW